MWIIDLLIDKLKQDKEKVNEWEPQPLQPELDYDDYCDKRKKEVDKKENRVIILDI